jgi:type IV secretion system protein VirB2
MLLKKSFQMLSKAMIIAFMAITLFSVAPVYQGNALTPAEGGAITEILCRASNFISGNTGKAIAVLVVISLAIALFLGKVSWGMAIAVAVGMGILFGAPGLVGAISGDSSFSTTCENVKVK